MGLVDEPKSGAEVAMRVGVSTLDGSKIWGKVTAIKKYIPI
jgi:hypothetical protein